MSPGSIETFSRSGSTGKQPEFVATVRPPFSLSQLKALPNPTVLIQSAHPLSPREWGILAQWFASHPDAGLRIYTEFGEPPYGDLEFLSEIPAVSDLQIDLVSLTSFEGLRHVSPRLTGLSLGVTRSKAPCLKILARFSKLQRLYVEGHANGIDTLSQLTQLRDLGLRGITLRDLRLLLPLRRLQTLAFHFGGTKDLSLLPQWSKLRTLTLSNVRGLSDLDCLAELERLEDLELVSLKHVTSLPSFERMMRLKKVHLHKLSQLSDLASIAVAPNLRELSVYDMPQLPVATFRHFAGHPRLRRVHTVLGKGLRGSRLDQAVKSVLPFATTWGDA
ncbi:MAG: hypothetical protein AB7O38_11435 [Pirellulaceae bacterium]